MMVVPGGTRRAAIEVVPATRAGVGGHARAGRMAKKARVRPGAAAANMPLMRQ